MRERDWRWWGHERSRNEVRLILEVTGIPPRIDAFKQILLASGAKILAEDHDCIVGAFDRQSCLSLIQFIALHQIANGVRDVGNVGNLPYPLVDIGGDRLSAHSDLDGAIG